MDITYYMKLQNAYGTKNKRERELAKVNRNADIHFDDTFDTADVIVNDTPMQIMIIKDTDGNVHKKKNQKKLSGNVIGTKPGSFLRVCRRQRDQNMSRISIFRRQDADHRLQDG